MATQRAQRTRPSDDTPELSPEQFPVAVPAQQEPNAEPEPKQKPWPQFIGSSTDQQVITRFTAEFAAVLAKHQNILAQYSCIALLDPDGSISSFDASMIYKALRENNPERGKNVLLLLLSHGGSIESAYQIAKLCKSYAREKFVVVVPRQAKSAATLISIGADEIHMGPLGQLGPIDPQIGGLPALGVAQALQTLAGIAEQHPGASEMLARYLQQALTVEQIGYCERIGESAAQYAERLLAAKTSSIGDVQKAAHDLVYEYKHHGFVIDHEEARDHLGAHWILSDTLELAFAEEVYELFELVNIFLQVIRDKRILVVGTVEEGTFMLNRDQ